MATPPPTQDNSDPKPQTMTHLQALLSTLPPITIPAPLTPLQEFILFPRLPAELRIKTWKHVTQVSRKVKIFEMNTISTRKGWDSRVEGQTWIPGIMQACSESRYEGGKAYKLCYEKPQPSQERLEVARAGQSENGVASSDEGATESDGQPEQAFTPLAARGARLYINFDRDLFVTIPHNQVSDTYLYEEALAAERFGFHSLPQRNAIANGGAKSLLVCGTFEVLL